MSAYSYIVSRLLYTDRRAKRTICVGGDRIRNTTAETSHELMYKQTEGSRLSYELTDEQTEGLARLAGGLFWIWETRIYTWLGALVVGFVFLFAFACMG